LLLYNGPLITEDALMSAVTLWPTEKWYRGNLETAEPDDIQGRVARCLGFEQDSLLFDPPVRETN